MAKIYPCDFTPYGECPKQCQDCAHCAGWGTDPEDEDE